MESHDDPDHHFRTTDAGILRLQSPSALGPPTDSARLRMQPLSPEPHDLQDSDELGAPLSHPPVELMDDEDELASDEEIPLQQALPSFVDPNSAESDDLDDAEYNMDDLSEKAAGDHLDLNIPQKLIQKSRHAERRKSVLSTQKKGVSRQRKKERLASRGASHTMTQQTLTSISQHPLLAAAATGQYEQRNQPPSQSYEQAASESDDDILADIDDGRDDDDQRLHTEVMVVESLRK